MKKTPLKIDSHQHFWIYDPEKHVWMKDNMSILKRNFLPNDLKPHLTENNIDGCVAVQASQTEDENAFLIQNAASNDFIKGIVGWVDLRCNTIEERLSYYENHSIIKGFRHVLHDEPQRDYMLNKDFINGISKLKKYNYTYDLLIFTDQLGYSLELVKQFPNQKFVIDHIAKPNIKEQTVQDWEHFMRELATFKNVYCKISAMVTEADWNNWKLKDFKIYIDIVVNAFGFDRIMYGSDWPVCQLAATYSQQYEIVEDYFSQFEKEIQDKFFGENAIQFYNLNI